MSLCGLFIALGLVFGVRNVVIGETVRALLGFATPLFLLLFPFSKRLFGGVPWLLLGEAFVFLVLAYDVGSVYNMFAEAGILDKVAHLFSGLLFTTVGYCFYAWLGAKQEKGGLGGAFLPASYAVFFSMFIAVLWECFEMTGFLLFGLDSQHTLTTGVFDTMGDLISCLVGSLVCGFAIAVWRHSGRRLLTGALLEEWESLPFISKKER